MNGRTAATKPAERANSSDPSHPVDGRRAKFAALLMWFLGSFCFFFAFFQRVTPSVLVDELMRDFGVTAGIVGTFSALYFYAYAGLQVPVGLLVDRWGARRMLSGAFALNGLGTLLFAATTDINLAYVGRLLIGVGSAVGWVGSLKLVAAWFPPKRFALVTGCTSALGLIGAVVGQAPMAMVVGAVGWRPALLGIGLFALIYSLTLWFAVRDAPPGSPASSSDRLSDVMSGLRSVVGRPRTWTVAFLSGAMVAPQASFGALWGVPYLMAAYGIDRTTAAASTSMLLLGWGVGGPVAGWISDRIALRRPPLIVGASVAFATMAGVIYIPGLPLAAAQGLLLINGIAAGSMILCYVTGRELNEPRASGAAIGVVNMMTMLSGAIAQTAIGWLLDVVWDGRLENDIRVYDMGDYHVAFVVLLVCGAAGVALALMIRETHAKNVVA